MEHHEPNTLFIVTIYPPVGTGDCGIHLQPMLLDAAIKTKQFWEAQGARVDIRTATKADIDERVEQFQEAIDSANERTRQHKIYLN